LGQFPSVTTSDQRAATMRQGQMLLVGGSTILLIPNTPHHSTILVKLRVESAGSMVYEILTASLTSPDVSLQN
jgi:hypothetical protein